MASLGQKNFWAAKQEGTGTQSVEWAVQSGNWTAVLMNADGSGVKVGVLSTSVDYLPEAQTNGNLGDVTVLPGQSGIPGSGEGTAMLEIVHAMAPGAQLFFATGGPTEKQFATNILNLRFVYGCDVIVDDISYADESPFQDMTVARAVGARLGKEVVVVEREALRLLAEAAFIDINHLLRPAHLP